VGRQGSRQPEVATVCAAVARTSSASMRSSLAMATRTSGLSLASRAHSRGGKIGHASQRDLSPAGGSIHFLNPFKATWFGSPSNAFVRAIELQVGGMF
jgi:hypothetical protein